MDISRPEQRVLHMLAQGGHIDATRAGKRIVAIEAISRDGWRFGEISLALFKKLRRRRTIASTNGGPYRITKRGLELVRPQLDNR